MKLGSWRFQIPNMVVAGGILVCTLAAESTLHRGLLGLLGPLLLALAVLGADILDSRVHGGPSRPSAASLLFGISFLVAGFILLRRDPRLIVTFFPTIGVACWVTLLLRNDRGRACGRPAASHE
jgi:hypothetical protein